MTKDTSDDKELQRLINEQIKDDITTEYFDEIKDVDNNEGLFHCKQRSYKKRHYMHSGGSSLLPITERNERMMIHLSNMNKQLPKFDERANIINSCIKNITNRINKTLEDESSIADDLEIIGDYLITIEDFIPRMHPNGQKKWSRFVSDVKQQVITMLPKHSLSEFWKKQ